MNIRRLARIIALSGVCICVAHSGIRGPGKYSGVVIFDRWDSCFLLSGTYVTYISKYQKDDLRPYAGKAMQIDAWDVVQPMNPGDALIRRYRVVGPAPEPKRWEILEGIDLKVQGDFTLRGSPKFTIEIRNEGSRLVEIHSYSVGPTLLANFTGGFNPSDDASQAVITRGDLRDPSSFEFDTDDSKFAASYTIDAETRPPETFDLKPGESRKIRIKLKIPAGQYQFMVGYGGGVHAERSIVSNALSFDIDEDGAITTAR